MTQGYCKLTPETWALARQDFLSGASAAQVCDRYGMGLRTLRCRSTADEAWRRTDSDDPVPPDWLGDSPDDLSRHCWDYDAEDAVDHAHDRLMAATLRGQSAEALRWFRLKTLWEKEAREQAAFLTEDVARCATVRQDRLACGLPVTNEDVDPADASCRQNLDATDDKATDPDQRELAHHPLRPSEPASAPKRWVLERPKIGTIGTIGTANLPGAIVGCDLARVGEPVGKIPSTGVSKCSSLLKSANLGPTTETILDPAPLADLCRPALFASTGDRSGLDLDPL